MKRLFIITWGIFFILPSVAQQSKEVKWFSRWENKARLGFSIVYDYHELDHRYSHYGIYNYIPSRGNPSQEFIPLLSKDYKIKKNKLDVIRLQIDYWLFPFLNIYATGGKIFNYSKITAKIGLENVQLPTLTSTQEENGWEYGAGIKGEFRLKRFKPQIGYSFRWDNHQKIHDKTFTQTVDIKLGYMIPVNKSWIKNIDIFAGSLYNFMKVKYDFYVLYNEQSLLELYRAFGIQISHHLGDNLDQIFLKNIHDWNMVIGADIELSYRFHLKLETSFLGRKTSISTAISYCLFNKK